MTNTNGNHLYQLNRRVISCRKCPRLVEWRERVAREKVARFSDCTYWGKPLPGFGDPDAGVLIVGLAPAAHGGNRTGRMFTGDRSGDWLFSTLHKFGFASQPTSVSLDDGLRLKDCYITAVVQCAPPQNKPLKEEIENCQPYLLEELRVLMNVTVIVALGKLAFDRTIISLEAIGKCHFDRKQKFAHGAEYDIANGLTLISSYHPSQQNTFTGKLTKPMFESIFRKARHLIGRIGPAD